MGSEVHFPFKYFLKIANVAEISPLIAGCSHSLLLHYTINQLSVESPKSLAIVVISWTKVFFSWGKSTSIFIFPPLLAARWNYMGII